MSYQSEMSTHTLDIGGVFSNAFKTLGENSTTFLILAGGLVTLPDAAIALLVKQSSDGATLERILNGVENLSLGIIANGALLYAALKTIRGEKPAPGVALSAGVRLWGPLLGISFLAGLGVLLGMLLLLVPGIFLAVAWSLAVIIRVDGNEGVSEALTRSFEMTRGSRWAIFAVWLIFWILFLICFVLLGAMSAVVGPSGTTLVDVVIVPVMTGVTAAVSSVISAAIFQDLNRAKATPAHTADVFD